MKIYFLLNPSHPHRWRNFRSQALQVARRQSHVIHFGEVDRNRPASMNTLVDEAQEKGCTRIVAVGGDGTYNRLIRLLAARNLLSQIEIGLVPGGTCNDFLRLWKISPRRVGAALGLACNAQAVDTDLGELNGELFLNNAGFGRRERRLPRRKVDAFHSLRQFDPVPLHATWDQGSLEGSFYMGLVCNGPFFSKGLYFSKSVSVDDARLDIFLVPRIPKAKLAAILFLGRLGRPLRTRHLITLRLKQLVLTSDRDLWPQVDGEPADSQPVRELHFKVADTKARIVRPNV